MKILVFDDSQIHREAAKLSLMGHDLTVVGTYDEAQDALVPKCDHGHGVALFKAKYGNTDPYACPEPEKAIRMAYYHECMKRATTYSNFDVVMTDLLVPASRRSQGRDMQGLVGKEMPLGIMIALLALSVGVKNVAVVTDMNHHEHPASAAVDCFGQLGKGKLPGVNIICTNDVGCVAIVETTGRYLSGRYLDSEKGREKFPESENWGERKGIRRGGKDWREILTQLLED